MRKNYFVNLHRLLVCIRDDIRRPENIRIVEAAIKSFIDKYNNNTLIETMSIYPFVYSLLTNEVETDVDVAETLAAALLFSLKRISGLLLEGAFDEAYDLVDAIHFLPELIVEQKTQTLATSSKHILSL